MRERGWKTAVAMWGTAAVLAWTAAPASLSAQGWVEIPPEARGRMHVEKVRTEVAVTVEGRVARVEVTEWFRNRSGQVVEGHYLYPLPGEAVFQGFSLFQGDHELRGEIMDAGEARRIYEEIVRRRADPALIELAGHGLLRARVFPIQPGEERKVTLRYTQLLDAAGGALRFVYAGSVRAVRPVGGAAEPLGAPLQAATDTRFVLRVEDGDAFLDPFSPTHDLDVRRTGDAMEVGLRDDLFGRLAVFLPLAGDAVGLSVAAHRAPGEAGYFMLTLSPGRATGPAVPRDVAAVLDVSGSMSGEKIEQAKEALRSLLASLGDGDRFRLVSFSTAVHRFSEGWEEATTASREAARAWIDDLVADGGTNIGAALDEAFRVGSPPDRLPVVVFLTDGLPSVGEQSPQRLADRAEASAGRARVFAFGVGHDVNTHLLDRLGEAGRGSTDYVQPGENVERAIALLAAKVRHPVLTDLEIDAMPVRWSEIYPVRIPDVFAGEELVLFGRYEGEGEGRVRIRGARAATLETFSVNAAFPRTTDANAYLPRLWASRKLGHLMRQVWTEGETESLRDEIRSLALRYGLPSPYTSYLVEEPDAVAFQAPPPAPGAKGVPMPMRGGTAPAAADRVAAASGAAAVRRAESARRMRAAESVGELEAFEQEFLDRAAARADAEEIRVAGGRTFALRDGVWRDLSLDEDRPVVRVKVFSPAYFDLVRALPELAPIVRAMREVVVAGGGLNVQMGEDGVDRLPPADLADLVRRFRETPTTR